MNNLFIAVYKYEAKRTRVIQTTEPHTIMSDVDSGFHIGSKDQLTLQKVVILHLELSQGLLMRFHNLILNIAPCLNNSSSSIKFPEWRKRSCRLTFSSLVRFCSSILSCASLYLLGKFIREFQWKLRNLLLGNIIVIKDITLFSKFSRFTVCTLTPDLKFCI